jgi:dihydrofolate reductase
MAKLIYVFNVSLDGYIADEDGKFVDWPVPDEEYFSFINDLLRPVGTYLYGRRLYEGMQVWETDPAAAAQSPGTRAFAEIWQSADKVVYSATLQAASTARTRIERDFDPEAVRQLTAAAERDVTVGGAALATHAIRAGLVDEYHLFVWPVVLGGGKPFLPKGARLQLELLDERRFGSGAVYLRYRTQT